MPLKRSITTIPARRRLITAGACLLLVVLSTGNAAAYLTASGSATDAATVGVLPAASVTATPGAGTVSLEQLRVVRRARIERGQPPRPRRGT